VIDAYVELLTEDYDFKLRYDGITDGTSIRTIILDYNGPSEGDYTIGTISTTTKNHSIEIWGDVEKDRVWLTYAGGLNYTDTGERYGQ